MAYTPRPGSQAETLVNAILKAGTIRSDALCKATGIPNADHNGNLDAAIQNGLVTFCVVIGGDGRRQREYRGGAGMPSIAERPTLKSAKASIVPVREAKVLQQHVTAPGAELPEAVAGALHKAGQDIKAPPARKPHALKPSAASVKANRVKAAVASTPWPPTFDHAPAAPGTSAIEEHIRAQPLPGVSEDLMLSGTGVVRLPADLLMPHVRALQAELDEGQRLVITHDSFGVVALGYHFHINPDQPGALAEVIDAVEVLRRAAA